MRSLLLVTAAMCAVFLSPLHALADQPADAKLDEKAKLLEERLELQRQKNELLTKEIELLKRETELLKKEGKKDAGKLFTGANPRVGVVNIWMVVKNYKKNQDLRADLLSVVRTYEDELAAAKKDMEFRQTQLTDPDPDKWNEETKKAIAKEIKRLQRLIAEKSDDMREELIKQESGHATVVYHDIEEAIRHVATSKGMELVSAYGDSPDEKDRNLGANLARKINTSAMIPLYIAPGVDLTEEVLKRLNEKYKKSPDSDGKHGTTKKD